MKNKTVTNVLLCSAEEHCIKVWNIVNVNDDRIFTFNITLRVSCYGSMIINMLSVSAFSFFCFIQLFLWSLSLIKRLKCLREK